MDDDYVNKLDWFTLAAAFTVWFAHFMLAWTISSVFPGEPIVLWLTLGLTVLALGSLAWLWRRSSYASVRTFSGIAIAVAGLAIAFDFAPALLA